MADTLPLMYRNTSSKTITLVGVGAVKGGETVVVDEEINAPHFELVKSKSEAKRLAATEAAKDEAVVPPVGTGVGQEVKD